ncbi:MAG: hypothetical protein AAB300_00305 [Nitrospirota bacterium]
MNVARLSAALVAFSAGQDVNVAANTGTNAAANNAVSKLLVTGAKLSAKLLKEAIAKGHRSRSPPYY